jgi:hypothetical protein
VPDDAPSLPDFTRWPSFPFEGDLRVKPLKEPVAVEPARSGEDASDCVACATPDDAYIWVSERWRVRGMDRPTGLPAVLILECRSHLDLGDLPNLLAAELGVMTVRLERAIRSLDGVARVHVNRWGDGSAHLHMWFLARPHGMLQLRGTFLALWDDILPVIPEHQWRENLALVAAWLAEFGGKAIAEPPHIQWESPATFSEPSAASVPAAPTVDTSGGPTFGGQTPWAGAGREAAADDEATADKIGYASAIDNLAEASPDAGVSAGASPGAGVSAEASLETGVSAGAPAASGNVESHEAGAGALKDHGEAVTKASPAPPVAIPQQSDGRTRETGQTPAV